MSSQVNVAHVTQFKAIVEMLLQQKDSRFSPCVEMRGDYVGKTAKFIEQIGAVAARKRTTRHGDFIPMNTPHDARWVDPSDWEAGDYVDNEDKLRMLIDPTSIYAQTFMAAMLRAKDDVILDAFFGDAKVGENGTTTVNWATFVAANPLHQIAAGVTGMTVAKLRAARKALRTAENDDEPLFVALSAEEEDDLLQETQVINLDYTDRPVLVEGKITRFMGFNFVHSEQLLTSGANRRCPAWAKSGMHLALWSDVYTSVDRIPTKGRTIQVYECMTIGASRTQEKKVVEILAA